VVPQEPADGGEREYACRASRRHGDRTDAAFPRSGSRLAWRRGRRECSQSSAIARAAGSQSEIGVRPPRRELAWRPHAPVLTEQPSRRHDRHGLRRDSASRTRPFPPPPRPSLPPNPLRSPRTTDALALLSTPTPRRRPSSERASAESRDRRKPQPAKARPLGPRSAGLGHRPILTAGGQNPSIQQASRVSSTQAWVESTKVPAPSRPQQRRPRWCLMSLLSNRWIKCQPTDST
jgi:hypothetical protein